MKGTCPVTCTSLVSSYTARVAVGEAEKYRLCVGMDKGKYNAVYSPILHFRICNGEVFYVWNKCTQLGRLSSNTAGKKLINKQICKYTNLLRGLVT